MTLTTTTTLVSRRHRFPERNVARPVANLGNTCYMNAVLQALAACPELCMALDCVPHRSTCSVYAENMARSRASSPSNYSNASSGTGSNDTPHQSAEDSHHPAYPALPHHHHHHRRTATRKSLRSSGRRTPSDDGKKSHNDWTFCALCELEEHIHKVHNVEDGDNSSSSSTNANHATTTTTATTSSSSAHAKPPPVAPTAFVHGFMEHVAPWFELGQQEDSHEFLRLLIDAMQKSCARARPREILPPSSLNDPDESGDILLPDDDSPTATRTRSARQKTAAAAKSSSSGSGTTTANNNNPQDTEYPFSLFRGMVQSTVTCEHCQASSSTMDPIEDIGLEVVLQPPGAAGGATSAAAAASSTTEGGPTTTTTMTRSSSRNTSPATAPPGSLADVTAAFQRFTRPEALDAGYKCEKCGKVGRATKQSRLADIPPILTLHLKRFRYGEASTTQVSSRRSGREVGQLLSSQSSNDVLYTGGSGSAKIEGHIKFDHIFDLAPYTTPELQKKHQPVMCRLFAVIVHAGKNSHSGHYIAYVRGHGKKEDWWKMDDGRVTSVSLDQVKKAEAYMLFYRVIRHPIAVQLEKDYKTCKEEARLLLQQEQEAAQRQNAPSPLVAPLATTASSATTSLSTRSSSRKRRASSAFANGEEWIQAQTTQPPPPPELIEFVKKTQEKIAQEAVLTPQARNKQAARQDVASSSSGAAGSAGPPGGQHTISDEDVEGGTDGFRQKILNMFYTINKEVVDFKAWLGAPPAQQTPASLPAVENAPPPDDQRVAVVVEPEEALDIL